MKSVSFLSSQFDSFNEKIDSIIIELKTIKLENEKIINENKRLSEEVTILKHKIDSIEQHNLGITVELTGIPNTQNEDCVSIIAEIGKKTYGTKYYRSLQNSFYYVKTKYNSS